MQLLVDMELKRTLINDFLKTFQNRLLRICLKKLCNMKINDVKYTCM